MRATVLLLLYGTPHAQALKRARAHTHTHTAPRWTKWQGVICSEPAQQSGQPGQHSLPSLPTTHPEPPLHDSALTATLSGPITGAVTMVILVVWVLVYLSEV